MGKPVDRDMRDRRMLPGSIPEPSLREWKRSDQRRMYDPSPIAYRLAKDQRGKGVFVGKLTWLVVPLALIAADADAIVIRHTQQDAQYRVDPQTIPALADLPDEGHGTLIAPRWIVTAAHAVSMMQMMPEERYVTLNGKRRAVSRIVVYPDYPAARDGWQKLFGGLKTADPETFAAQYVKAMADMHDIALLELAEPVTDVKPMPVYWGNAKPGILSTVYGAGATGTDVTGAPDNASHRTQLRRAENRLTRTDGQWLRFAFDCGAHAPLLSGATAGGDSGGPVTIDVSGRKYLAGITHGLDATLAEEKKIVPQMQDGSFRMGLCGQTFAATRVAFYKAWLDRTIAGK
jgi:hypothetical protein